MRMKEGGYDTVTKACRKKGRKGLDELGLGWDE